MADQLLRHTKGLSPLSLQTIEAEVISDGSAVFMVKKDEKGREYRTVMEKDPALYALLTGPALEPSAKMQFISTYTSAKCNLNCQVCYEGSDKAGEIEPEEVKELLKKYPDCRIILTGMEPTCRDDIFDLIAMAKGRASLNTNGIKLASPEYVKKLKARGLKKIFFSFNGLNDDVYRKINGADLLELKLKALENIGREKIDTFLSATLARGINENQILPLVEFCFERRSFIVEMRFRTMAHVGKHLNTEQICLSELITMVAGSLKINQADIIREFRFIQAFIEKFGRRLPKGLKDKYRPKLCSFIFHVRKEGKGKYSSPGSRIDLEKINRSSLKSFWFFYYLVRAYGPALLAEMALHFLNMPRFVVGKKMLNITLRYWPNLYNVDLAEMDKCPSIYYKNGVMEKLCLALIKNSAREAGNQS
jgi:MoaA/NifB/PqqE/SkfB family radical SAM enzyme